MEKEIFNEILRVQDQLYSDPEDQVFIAEHDGLNERFLSQLATMNQEQRDAVMDYCGWMIESHLRILKRILKCKSRKRER